MYRMHILDKIRSLDTKDAEHRVQMLRDAKYLGCWCKPEACHGDILIKLIITGQL